ncbi:hypothetical protein CSE16_13360 [Solibacillus sp. R5-41]|uniref:hypothetical protein n=1 Tax=Solibacillus sp. R5-41 TaxID=2048654 RepID=UPI000C127237|nr:hypothetical protein [Solibacillus sp. R5-41]ATP40960.1 hypothetical protein CSE16_13360 [Solibacillus sp. R5-41]
MDKKQANRPLLLIGSVVVIIVVFIFTFNSTNKGQERLTDEQQLAQILSGIQSVGQVQVYFHYEQETESGNFLTLSKEQKMTGVIIVAEGAHQSTVKNLLKTTVSTALQIPSHRIQIVPMQMKEEEK